MAQEFTDTETRTEDYIVPIYGKVAIVPERNATVVGVGNTGFRLRFFRHPGGAWADLFDFVPEGNFGEDSSKLAKHATMLGFSLYEIYRWMKAQDSELKALSQRVGGIGWVMAHTNQRLIKSLANLFSGSGHPELVIPNEEDFSVSVDFKGLSELGEDDVLITKLRNYHGRARDYTVLVKRKAE